MWFFRIVAFSALCLLSLPVRSVAQDPELAPRMYLGINLGGGVSAIFNHNTFGLPKMDYNLSGIQVFGVNAGYAPQPWSRIQVGLNYMQGRYLFTDAYGPYAQSTEASMEMQKRIVVSYLQVPLTYRYYLYDQQKLLALRRREVKNEIKRENILYLLGGIQMAFLQTGSLDLRKRNLQTGGEWIAADLGDLKPVFDSFLPVHRIPDALPSDRKRLYANLMFDLVLGIGWNKKLGDKLDLGLEGWGSISINDLNSADRAADGSYAWRRPYYLRDKPYRAAYLGSLGLSGVLNFAL